MSSRRVNSVKELNRLTERIAELDKALDDICEQVAVLDTRNAELEAKLDKVREITDEMGEDTRLGNAAIGHGVTVVGSYLERLEAALEGEE
jgi:chromosome segregation ATPase